MLRPLNTHQLGLLNAVHGQLQAGDPAGALARFDALDEQARGHPNALMLQAFILQGLGRLQDAREVLERALAITPHSGPLLNSYGNLLDDLGQGAEAVAALQRAVAVAPTNDHLINLGIVACNAGQLNVAEDALGKAIRNAPAVARGWSVLAMVEEKKGNADMAADLYRRAIAIDADDMRSRHNLATLLRKADRTAEALEEAENALRQGPVPPETATLRAHLLADAGRPEEAAAEYENILSQVPEQIDAHETLASLLPQIGRGSQALVAYRAALQARPSSEALWGSALRSAFAQRDFVQLAAWSQEAEGLIGPLPEIRVARAAALSGLGNQSGAIDLLRGVLADDAANASAHQHLAHALTISGDPRTAERHALAATTIDPLDQAPWALLGVVWRLLDDPRETWLADYDRLVMPIDLDAAPGFFEELGVRLTEMHTMRHHPGDQSLRGGTQTRGNLFDRRDPLIQRLAAQVRSGVLNALRKLPADPSHPFLSRITQNIAFAGSWSVRLRSEGFHVSHIHQRGWISSALYVSLPPQVGQGDAGALAFGVPDAAFGQDLPPRRIERPQVGRLVIFPSYFWHGTLPFESAQPRLTVAFDALPA